MNLRKAYIIVFIVLIIATGIFRSQVSLIYSIPLNYLLAILGFDPAQLMKSLSILARDNSIDHGLGVFFYYPTYLLLHFALIHNLFYENKVLKMKLIYTLSIVVLGLGGLTAVFKVAGLTNLYNIAFQYFELVAGRPLILFLIEGGGMIYQLVEDSTASDNE